MKTKKHPRTHEKYLTEGAKIFGFGFFLLGAAGFAPFLTVDGKLFDIFAVSPAQNFFHMVVGTAALLASSTGPYTSRFLFQILAVSFAALASLDYINSLNGMFSELAGNGASFLLHGAAALASAALGFTDATEYVPSHRSSVSTLHPRRNRRRPTHAHAHTANHETETLVSTRAA